MSHFAHSLRLNHKDRFALFFAERWLILFGIFYGIFVGLPFLAPVFMRLGWEAPGDAIYWFYSFLCHQLPERSFFMFGPKGMYSLAEVQAAWQNTINPLVLRHFIGNGQMGWKVGWSDRMVSMYTSIWIFGLLWWSLRRKLGRLPLWGFVLLAMPMVIDGSTHLFSDLAGIGQGFRYTNAWLSVITHNALPATFYLGDAFGSFNSWMRLITGTLFGLGFVFFGFPYFQEVVDQTERLVRAKYAAREQILIHAFRSAGQEISDADIHITPK
jgi:uncharacterized membrane protein